MEGDRLDGAVKGGKTWGRWSGKLRPAGGVERGGQAKAYCWSRLKPRALQAGGDCFVNSKHATARRGKYWTRDARVKVSPNSAPQNPGKQCCVNRTDGDRSVCRKQRWGRGLVMRVERGKIGDRCRGERRREAGPTGAKPAAWCMWGHVPRLSFVHPTTDNHPGETTNHRHPLSIHSRTAVSNSFTTENSLRGITSLQSSCSPERALSHY